MQPFICAFLFFSFAASSVAGEQTTTLDNEGLQAYTVYEAAGRLGTQMFFTVYKKDGFGLRAASMLRACGQDGLARAVDAKQSDPTFKNELTTMISDGRFRDLPNYAILSAQNVANAMRAGYVSGFQEANKLALSLPSGKEYLCEVAVKSANEILK
jgi:hypothetical protein